MAQPFNLIGSNAYAFARHKPKPRQHRCLSSGCKAVQCVQGNNAVGAQVPLVMDSMSGHNILLKLRKRPGMEAEDVLADPKGTGRCSA